MFFVVFALICCNILFFYYYEGEICVYTFAGTRLDIVTSATHIDLTLLHIDPTLLLFLEDCGIVYFYGYPKGIPWDREHNVRDTCRKENK